MDDFLITTEHWRILRIRSKGGFCVAGARAWASSVGIDFEKFIREGLPASVFLATNDAIALELVQAAREAIEDGQG